MKDALSHNILVVEYDDLVRNLLVSKLSSSEEYEYSVVSVSGIRQAMCLLFESNENSLDLGLIIVNLLMEDGDAIEFLRFIADYLPYSPPVIISAESQGEILHSVKNVIKSNKFNVLDIIRSPIDMAKLIDLINGYFDKVSPDLMDKCSATVPVPVQDEINIFSEAELRLALDDNQFFLVYQPVVSLNTGDTVSLEILVRWRHPGGDVILPSHFLPLLEYKGWIDELMRYVVKSALAQLACWRSKGLDLQISMNINTHSLESVTFPDLFDYWVKAEKVPPEKVTIEVTESQANTNFSALSDCLTRLRIRGYDLAIDDFGVGYASLKRLDAMPFTELKLDAGYVVDMMSNDIHRAIVANLVSMSKSMGLKVVAEGVESADVYYTLKRLGCDEAQGFFISRPIDGASVEDWLSERQVLSKQVV